MQKFSAVKNQLAKQYREISWDETSGLSYAALQQEILRLEDRLQGKDCAIVKAETFALLLEKGQLALTENDIFQEKVNAIDLMKAQRMRWYSAIRRECFEEVYFWASALRQQGLLIAKQDFGHTTADTQSLLQLGIPGLLQRLELAEKAHGALTEEQEVFYAAGRTVLQALRNLCLRFAEAQQERDPENSACFRRLAEGKPQNLYDAMQLLIVYFFAHEYVGGTRMRTLGRLDRILYPFYQKDLENGTITEETAEELVKYFLHKFWTMKVDADMPFCIGGQDENGDEVTNDLSYLIVKAYRQLNIYSPKIHVRVSEKTPASFVKSVLACIRAGSSSFVFTSDAVGIAAMQRCGATLEEARNFVLIGCYEPAVFGQEVPCTGTADLSLPKVLELVFTNGLDHGTGLLMGLATGQPETYEEFVAALKRQIQWLLGKIMKNVSLIESYYPQCNPDPLLSVLLAPSVEKGKDCYCGGAKYNNSNVTMACIGSFADGVYATKKLVYDEKRMTFAELGEILKNNWEGHEDLRQEVLHFAKYGNHVDEVDQIAVEFAHFFASVVNGQPNGRGGIFRAGNYSINRCFTFGKVTMATPDGRKTGDPLSKNMGAATGMDRKGITAVINSVTKMDLSLFGNGSVLDFVLHPTAVQGEEGLDMMYALLLTYFKKGGSSIHGNVFDAEMLRKAQQEPEKFANLQVRVCGWNAYFCNLSKDAQDAFIRQAEMALG